jgi:hypothetical protein
MRRLTALSGLLLVEISCRGVAPAEPGTIGPGGYESLPAGVTEYLPQEQVSEMVTAGLVIHAGGEPPSIEGSYDLRDLALVALREPPGRESSFSIGDSDYEQRWVFGSREAGYPFTSFILEGDSADEPYQPGLETYVAGDGIAFTVFVKVDRTVAPPGYTGDLISDSATFVLSGTVGAEGIENPQVMKFFVRTTKSEGEQIDYTLYEEQDGLASRVQ